MILLRKSEGIKGLPNRYFAEPIRWVPLIDMMSSINLSQEMGVVLLRG